MYWKTKRFFSTGEALSGKKLLQQLNSELKSAVKQTTPSWLNLLLLNLPFFQHQNLKYSKQQKNLFGCLLTAGIRDRRKKKKKTITFNKPHTNHLGFPALRSWKNISEEIYLCLTYPSSMFLERANSKGKSLGEKNFRLKLPKAFFPHQTFILSTCNMHTACAVHLGKAGWLQSLSSVPAGISKLFSQRKAALLFGRLPRITRKSWKQVNIWISTRGKIVQILTVHRVNMSQCCRQLYNVEPVPSSNRTSRDFRRSSDTLSLLINSSLDQVPFQPFDFNPISVHVYIGIWALMKRRQMLVTVITLKTQQPVCSCDFSRGITKILSNPTGMGQERTIQISSVFKKVIAKLSKMFLSQLS